MSLISLTTAVLTVLISGNFVLGSLTAPAGYAGRRCSFRGGCRGVQVHRHGRFSVSVNFVFVSPDGSACPESFWSARARSVPFTLADQVVTGTITGS